MAQATARIKLTVEQREALRKLEQVKDRISGLARTVGLLGGAFGAVGIGAFVSKAVMTAARTRELGIVLRTVGQAAGYSAEYLDELEKKVIGVGIQTQVARQVLLRMIQTNVDLSKAVDLARASQAAAVIAGEDTSEALEAIIHGIVTLQPEVLRTHGIFVNLEQEYRKFAEQAGRTVESLSMQEKQQIAINAAIESSTKIMGAYGAAMREAGKQFRTWRGRELKNMLEALGEIGMPAFEALVEWLREITTRVTEWAKANQQVLKQKVKEWVEGVRSKLEEIVPWLERNKGLIKDIVVLLAALWAGNKLLGIARELFLIAKAVKAIGAAHPLLAVVVGAIGLLTAAILRWRKAAWDLQRDRRKERQEIRTLLDRYGELRTKVEKTTQEKVEFAKVIGRLNELAPELAANLEAAAEAGEHALENTLQWAKSDIALVLLRQIREAEEEIAKIQSGEMKERINRFGRGANWVPGAEVGARRVAELRERIAELRSELEAFKRGGWALMTPEEFKKTAEPPPPPGPTPEQIEQWKKQTEAAFQALHDLRMKLIADETDREAEQAYKAFKQVEAKITAAQLLSAEERYALLMEANSIYMEKLREIQLEEEKKRREAERDAAEERVQILMEELEYKKRLYNWDTQRMIEELQVQLDAAEEGSEYRKALMEELAELQRERDIEIAEAEREREEQQAELTRRFKDGIADALASVLMFEQKFGDAIRNLALQITNELARKAIRELIDSLWNAVKVASLLRSILTFLGFFGGGSAVEVLEGGVAPPVYAQRGALIRKPTLLLAGEAGEARSGEVVSPVPMLRRIIREETAALAGAQLNINLTINAIDAANTEAWIRGPGGEIIKRAVMRGWLDLQGAM